MAAYKFMPEDWQAMRDGLRAWALAALGSSVTVVWGQQNAPAPAKPYVYLREIVPPKDEGRADQSINLPGLVLFIKTVASSSSYDFLINGIPLTFASDPTATQAEIAAGIHGVITTAAISGVSSSLLAGHVRVVGAGTIATSDAKLLIRLAKSIENNAVGTFQVDVIGRDALNPPEAQISCATLQASLGSEEILSGLLQSGWSVVALDSFRKPDVVLGASWEDRAGFDIRLRCRTRRLELVDWIETATMGSGIVGTVT